MVTKRNFFYKKFTFVYLNPLAKFLITQFGILRKHFTSNRKENYNLNGIINKVSVYHSKLGSWSDEIHSYVYTDESNSKKVYAKLKKGLEKFIYEKFGRYAGATNILNTLEI